MGISSFDYLPALEEIEDEVMAAIRRVLHSGRLVLGPETSAFEDEFAAWIGADHGVGVTSGTTAIEVALRALGIGEGDEVITVANTCTPTVAAIRNTGAMPVFVDVDPATLMMDVAAVEDAISPRTAALLPVHLYGRAVDMERLLATAGSHGLPVIEDCAQATGTTIEGRHVGTLGTVGCFSFYPTKNLGAYGDGGAVVTDDPDLAARVRQVRMYGYDGSPVAQIEGTNGRINEVQAAILRVKLPRLDAALETRRRLATTYDTAITTDAIGLPPAQDGVVASHHLYVVRCSDRDLVVACLEAADIGYGIHYPTPVHRMPAYRDLPCGEVELPVTDQACDEVLSLPLHEAMTTEQAVAVADVLNTELEQPQ